MENLRILIIDDELGMRHSIARALRPYRIRLPDVEGDTGFEIDAAGTVADGLAKLREAPPDILLLDYKLPDGTGLDVLEFLKASDSRVLTVMVTAYATLDTAIRATKSGAHDFLVKPFTPTELKDTVRKSAEHLIMQRQARRLAEEKRKVRFQFIRVLGHELKAPLAAVEGFLQLLSDRTLGDDITQYDEIIRRCLTRTEGMRKLITDLLDLTRIESGERRRAVAPLDLVAVARTALETAAPAALKRGVALALEAPPSLLIPADRVELDIIFNNLISNGVKYNREQGRVDVRLELSGDAAVITVADNGIGMSTEETARLFQDFVRIRNEKTRLITGSGLGLSTVRKIAELYQGSVTVSSAPDTGSTFTVRLGLPPPAPPNHESQPNTSVATNA